MERSNPFSKKMVAQPRIEGNLLEVQMLKMRIIDSAK